MSAERNLYAQLQEILSGHDLTAPAKIGVLHLVQTALAADCLRLGGATRADRRNDGQTDPGPAARDSGAGEGLSNERLQSLAKSAGYVISIKDDSIGIRPQKRGSKWINYKSDQRAQVASFLMNA